MFKLTITYNGEILHESQVDGEKSAEQYSREWVSETYDDTQIAESDGYIPNGCADYRTEITTDDQSFGSCWESFDFFLER